MSCEFSAVRRPGAAVVWSGYGRRPSSTTALITTKRPTLSSKPAVRCCASRRDDDAEFSCGGGGGRMVDEGMIVLRRRIHEMRAAETNWEPPAEWAPWEEWYGTYDGDVCELVGVLQAFLMGSRPAIGVGLLSVLVLSVPASAFVLVSNLLDASRAAISSLQQ